MAKSDKLKKLIEALGGEVPATDNISDCLDALCGCKIGGGGGAANLFINVENNTYLCDIPLTDLFAKLKNEGLSACNFSIGTSVHRYCNVFIYAYAPNWVRCEYLSTQYTGDDGSVPMLALKHAFLFSDGTVDVQDKGYFTGVAAPSGK